MPANKKLSRLEFIKFSFSTIFASILAACGVDKPDLPPTPSPTADPTNTPTQTPTPTPTSTSTPTPIPTETPIPCFSLLEPADGAALPDIGRIVFMWESQVGASLYRFEIDLPNGTVFTTDIDTTSYERYLASFPMGGEYTWKVLALDANSEIFCLAGPFSFSKAVYVPPTATNKPRNNPDPDPGDGGPGATGASGGT